ncbi:outer membrane beta-barrel protein [Shewanella sp. VB17]|uniref:outer membrane beta-barrel protein n=1 Tax=Shewanella sp. VB17 TaxID=2739432 RepID=UPI0020B6815F|nr:outer membrane beta-barrel protein [Shewanella sp. VB17]
MTTCLLVASAVFADVFVAPFGGYSVGTSEFSVKSADTSHLTNNESGNLTLSESEHYGLMMGFTTLDPGDIYLMYSHQSPILQANGSVSTAPIIDLDLDYLHIGGTLYFPNGNLKPYVSASLGLTSMRPSGEYSNETLFSMGLGAGIDYQLTSSISIFSEARGYATFIDSDSMLFCDDGDCLWSIRSDIMWQGQINLGAKLKF